MIAQLNPDTLTRTERAALRRIHDNRMYRNQGGYGHSPNRVTLATVNDLQSHGLVRIDRTGRDPRPVLTGAGMMLLNVLDQRRASA